jgi:DNA polymerase
MSPQFSPELGAGITSVLEDIEKYLRAQSDLFGNEMLVDRIKGIPAEPLAPVRKHRETSPAPAAEYIPATLPLALVAEPSRTYAAESWAGAADLVSLNGQICNCLKCGLGSTRTKFVFGSGNPSAKIMFIGEAPGADEDMQGLPFVGRAGQLLTKIIEAIEFKRDDVYICNILKCRPPNNREPLPEEMEQCTPYLDKQIELVKPAFIVCLGRTSAQWILKTKESLSGLRSRTHTYGGAIVVVTYHPAALLRNPNWKRPAWEDMKLLKKMYKETINTSGTKA